MLVLVNPTKHKSAQQTSAKLAWSCWHRLDILVKSGRLNFFGIMGLLKHVLFYVLDNYDSNGDGDGHDDMVDKDNGDDHNDNDDDDDDDGDDNDDDDDDDDHTYLHLLSVTSYCCSEVCS